MLLANKIDHTALKPDTTKEHIEKLCEEAKTHHFFSVCVNPTWVSYAKQLLKGSNVAICTVIGFPLGATTSTTKAYETKYMVEKGATEVDMVINIGVLKSGDHALVQREIEAVVQAAGGQALVKVIIETALLTDEEKKIACKLAVAAGAHYVKTSTGFSTGGATIEDIQLMRKTVGPNIGVKASGGIRDANTARQMIEAGASRIGASSSVAIMKEEKGEKTN